MPITPTQRAAAKRAGAFYLLTNVAAFVSGALYPFQSIADISGTTPLATLAASQFRAGVACDLLTFAGDLVLIVALFQLLEPVGRGPALLATAFRLIETAAVVVSTFYSADVLRLTSGAAYLAGMPPGARQALIQLAIGGHGAAYNVGLLYLGLGSTLFDLLFFRSGFIPKPLAAFGVFSAMLTVVSTVSFVADPNLATRFAPTCYMPILAFELITGVWLLARAIRPAA